MIFCKVCGDPIESGKRRTCWKCERAKAGPRSKFRQKCGHCHKPGHNVRTCEKAKAFDAMGRVEIRHKGRTVATGIITGWWANPQLGVPWPIGHEDA